MRGVDHKISGTQRSHKSDAEAQADPVINATDDRWQEELHRLGAETQNIRRAKHILPWIISIALHLFALAIGFLIPWTIYYLQNDETTVATAVMADFYHLSAVDLDSTTIGSDAVVDHSVDLNTTIEIPTVQNDLIGDVASPTQLLGPSSAKAMEGFAPRGGGDHVSFGGLRGSNARNIVYIVDASGSMLTYLPIVIDELIRSIDQLDDRQNFGVVFFKNQEAIIVPAPIARNNTNGNPSKSRTHQSVKGRTHELLAGTQENKLHVFDWIDLDRGNIFAQGGSNPVAAIKVALQDLTPTPDIVFILSTDITGVGEFEEDQKDLLQMIQRLNKTKNGSFRSVIKTIQFITEDPLQTLEIIAKQNGGIEGYRFLSRADLGLEPDHTGGG